jgi:DNA segregation ATPase FtsK/SpoIIIE-like protein
MFPSPSAVSASPTAGEADDALFHATLDLVHMRRAASIPLVQRHLNINAELAENLMRRIERETAAVMRLDSGIYLYTPAPLAQELIALRAFAGAVIAELEAGKADLNALRAAARGIGALPNIGRERPTTEPSAP